MLNFSKAYTDYENPACVNTNNALVVSMTVPHNILMTEHMIETHVVRQDCITKLCTALHHLVSIVYTRSQCVLLQNGRKASLSQLKKVVVCNCILY